MCEFHMDWSASGVPFEYDAGDEEKGEDKEDQKTEEDWRCYDDDCDGTCIKCFPSFRMWECEPMMREVRLWLNEEDLLQDKIRLAHEAWNLDDTAWNLDELISLCEKHHPDRVPDLLALRLYRDPTPVKDKKDLDDIKDSAIGELASLASHVEEQKIRLNELGQEVPAIVTPNLAEYASNMRCFQVAQAKKHNDHLAMVSADSKDPRLQHDWTLTFEEHLGDLQGEAASKFQQKLQQTALAQQDLLYEEVQLFRADTRDANILDQFVPKLCFSEESRSSLEQASDIHEKMAAIPHGWQELIDNAMACIEDIDDAVRPREDSIQAALDELNQEDLACIQAYEREVLELQAIGAKFQRQAGRTRDAFLKKTLVKTLISQMEVSKEEEIQRLAGAKTAEPSARKALADLMSTATEAKAELVRLVSEQLSQCEVLVSPALKEEAVNAKLGYAVLDKKKLVLQAGVDQYTRCVEALDAQIGRMINSGGNKMNVRTKLNQMTQRKKEFLARKESACERLERTTSALDAARDQWDKLLQLQFGHIVDQVSAEDVADTLASMCYEKFDQEVYQGTPDAPLPADPSSPAPSSSTDLVPTDDILRQLVNVRKDFAELKNEVAFWRFKAEQTQQSDSLPSGLHAPRAETAAGADDAMTTASDI
eukprot:TRINITY_DN15316_c0_g1_i1.p1 TRINITY_DN15316_c0_g1~~TRINITY_DN15316_c0_g1_i1.p1  ORF type:complete len:652 (-),score=164.12 TRINITY_DN15316_c0_g1_i1:632-2587(-)